jgi:hypothetical protein
MNNNETQCNSNETQCNSNETQCNSNIINDNIIFSASYGCSNYGNQDKYGFIENNKSINNCNNYHNSGLISTPSKVNIYTQ